MCRIKTLWLRSCVRFVDRKIGGSAEAVQTEISHNRTALDAQQHDFLVSYCVAATG
jgi:hypothetical protein